MDILLLPTAGPHIRKHVIRIVSLMKSRASYRKKPTSYMWPTSDISGSELVLESISYGEMDQYRSEEQYSAHRLLMDLSPERS